MGSQRVRLGNVPKTAEQIHCSNQTLSTMLYQNLTILVFGALSCYGNSERRYELLWKRSTESKKKHKGEHKYNENGEKK